MPLSSLSLTGSLVFSLTKAVSGWASAVQGKNQINIGDAALSVDDWDQVYAAVIPLAASGAATIDLSSFTSLLDEPTGLVSVIAIVIKVAPDDPADPDVLVTVAPGASNGLEWLTGGSDPLTLRPGVFSYLGSAGFTVDGTRKALDLENTGADDGTVTIAVIGATT